MSQKQNKELISKVDAYAKSISKNDTYREYLKNAYLKGREDCENKEEEQKYYFVTYQGHSKYGSQLFQMPIDCHPIDHILEENRLSNEPSNTSIYSNFVLINQIEITKEEYEKYKDEF